MKKYTTAMIILALAAAILLFFFRSESESIDTLIHAPAQESGNGQIWIALEKSAGGKYILKTPTDGAHRSALVYEDLDADGEDEVIVFYSAETAKDSVCMQVFTRENDGWKATAGIKSGFGEIKQVEFADLDGNGKLEIVAGWGLQKNNILQQISVYRYNKSNVFLDEIFDEKYLSFGLFDLNLDGRSEIVLVTSDITTEPVVQKLTLFSYSGSSFKSVGTIKVDPSITTVSSLNFDYYKRTASSRVYIDGYTVDGLLSTDLILFDSATGKLERCYIDRETVGAISKRNINVFCSDINSDGMVEIPTSKNVEHNGTAFSLIEWKALFKDNLSTVCYYYDNRENGYFFSIPEIIMDISYPSVSADGKRLGFYLSEPSAEDEEDAGLLFEIVFETAGTVNLISTQYRFIGSHRRTDFYCRITDFASNIGITKKLISSSVIFV